MSSAKDFVIKNGVLKRYKGTDADIVIPKGVTSIGESAFQECDSVQSVTIPDGVVSIGMYAFSDCCNLVNVVVPDSVTSVGPFAFDFTPWLENRPKGIITAGRVVIGYSGNDTDIVIPDGITVIGDGAFNKCKDLQSVTMPESITNIGCAAFACCSALNSVIIPESVKKIENQAFQRCSNLQRISIKGNTIELSKQFADLGSLIEITDIEMLPADYRPFAALCYAKDGGKKEDQRQENHLNYIKANAKKLIDLAISQPELLDLMCKEKLLTLQNAALYQGAAQKAGKAEAITIINNYIENDFDAAKKKTIEEAKNKVDERKQERAGKEGISGLVIAVTGTLETFDNRDELIKLIEMNGGKYAASLTSKVDFLIMNDGSKNSEKQMKAKALGIDIISERQFNSKIKRMFITKEFIDSANIIKYIAADRDVIIPEGIKYIKEKAFYGCKDLYSVTISGSVKGIGDFAFMNCTKLSSVTIPDSVEKVEYGAFENTPWLANHPKGLIYAGKTVLRYTGKDTDIQIENGITRIQGSAFKKNSSIINVTIPDSVTSIGGSAFKNCSNLKSITISKNITSIDPYLFQGCSNLTEVKIPEGVTQIWWGAFDNCSNLESVTVPDSVSQIEKGSFGSCNKLVLHVKRGSYAEKFAKENGIPIEYIDA